jgi:hypothetical protein
MKLEYFIGHGDILIAQLDANYNPLAFRDVGEAPVFEFDPTTEFADNFATSKASPNLQDLHLPIKNTAVVHLTLKERTAKNLELELFGVSSSDVAGDFTGDLPFPDALKDGDKVLIPPGNHVGITDLIIHDSTPATPIVVAETDYEVDADAPFVTFLNVTTYVQPFVVTSYSYGAADIVSILEKPTPELCVIFDGKNLALPDERIWCRLDRVAFAAAAKVSLKSGGAGGTPTEVASYELVGSALVIPGRSSFGDYRVF